MFTYFYNTFLFQYARFFGIARNKNGKFCVFIFVEVYKFNDL